MTKILLIDDEEEIRTLIVETLQQHHEVYTVDNWARSLPYIFEKDIELVLVDVKMPGFKGDKVAEMLRARVQKPLKRPFKIVLFSSIDEWELREKAEQAKADGYIVKTMDERILLREIAKFS